MPKCIAWRFASVLAVVALLLTGFAAASVAAGAPCETPMTTAAGTPCDGSEPASGHDDQKTAPAGLACFAKCPAPVLEGAPAAASAPIVLSHPAFYSRNVALVGVRVAPPDHPPRV